MRCWAYLDDRSLKAAPEEEDLEGAESLEDAAERLTQEALLHTEQLFDRRVGLTENKKKRQLWRGDQGEETRLANTSASQ